MIYVAKQDMLVPCGKCAFCAATRRSDWALRLHYESKKHLDSCFVTLTYSDNNLRWSNGNSQLVKRDLQLFFKRLRKAGHAFRYYAVGEYGSTTFRPHYHILFFGLVPQSAIEKHWKLGLTHYGKVTQASIMYCLGYMVNGKSWKMRNNRVPPFNLMSRGGKFGKGLGANYLSKSMIAWHRSGRKNYAVLDGVRRHLPRYYKLKIFSKVDLVRIAVRDQKEVFKRMVDFIRSPVMRKHPDPLAYYEQCRRRMAQSISFKSKQKLIL